MSSDSIFWLLQNIWRHLSSRRQIQIVLVLFLMIIASLAEVLSIGAVLPFLGVLTAPERVFDHPSAQPFIQFFGITSATQLLLPLTLAFAAAAVLAGGTRLILLWASMRVSYATGADLSYCIYQRTLYQPYSVHVARNSSEVIAGISVKVEVVIYNLLQVLNLISASLLLISILIVLLVIDPLVATTAMCGFSCIYLLIIRITRSRAKANSHRIARNSSQVIKALQEGLGGIRDVLIDGSQATYCQIYRHADLPLRKAQGSNSFISSSPRTCVEALSMMLIAGLAYALSTDAGGFGKAIPILGALALGAQRMLPSMQQAYASWASLRGAHVSLKDAVDLLNQPLPDYVHQAPTTPVPFKQHIALRQVGFRYTPQSHWVFRNVNLTIPKGSRIGFIGTTGSGKSTLLDIVMSLLSPTEGTFEVDGKPITPANHRAWQAHIAHVPQLIFLTDSSIAENIAFGIPKNQIDLARVRLAAQQAQISEAIESWPQKYNTLVGERGIRLSGGQRQRIGIARALYKQANVIIFDEATSALDNDTEQAVMQEVESLIEDLTVLIIAHRLTTLRNCTQIVELGDRGIARIGTYRDIVASAM
jgi:ABC-type multidrug transport system fused ATPase/permease subunit